MVSNMSIKAKFYGVIAGISVLLVILGCMCLQALNVINEKSTEIANLWMPSVGVAGELNTLTSDYRIAQYRHVLSETKEEIVDADKTLAGLEKQINEKFAEYEKSILSDERRSVLNNIKDHWQSYVQKTQYIIDLSRQNKISEAGKELRGETREVYLKVCEEIGNLNQYCIKNGKAVSVEGDQLYDSVKSMMIISIVIIVIVTIVLLFFIARNITNGIMSVLLVSEKIAEGDLKVNIQAKSNDEIGKLMRTTDKMAQNLRLLISQIQKTSSQVAASSEELTASADQSAQVTQSIAQSVTDVSELSSNQVASVNSATQVIERISAGIEETSATVEMVAGQTASAVNTAQQGKSTIDNAVSQMTNIEQTVNRSATVVEKLGQRSKEIGQIVDTIAGIAGQTNLLALNAAIEAARAGEQGKGFAVVAEEVRKLAEQAQEAAKQIGDLIAEIQGDTDQAVVAMSEGTQEVRQGTSVVNEAGEAFVKILEMVNQMNDKAGDVAKTMVELTNGTQQVVEAVQTIDNSSKNVADEAQSVSAAAEEQSASMQEIAAASRNLSNLAQELQLAGSKFQL